MHTQNADNSLSVGTSFSFQACLSSFENSLLSSCLMLLFLCLISFFIFLCASVWESTSTERIACILCIHLGLCRFFTHPTAFYFSCAYTNGISLRIILKDYTTTQTLINETVLIGFAIANPKPQLKAYYSLIFFGYCSILKITELTLVYMPILSTYMLYSNQLLVYQFDIL